MGERVDERERESEMEKVKTSSNVAHGETFGAPGAPTLEQKSS